MPAKHNHGKTNLLNLAISEADCALAITQTLLKEIPNGKLHAQLQGLNTRARAALSLARSHSNDARKAAQIIMDTL